MNRRRWLVLILLLLIVIGITMFFSYRAIHADLWQEKAAIGQMIEQQQEYDLKSVERLEKYVWEDVYWILLATKAEDGITYYSAWSREDKLAELAYHDTIPEERILAIVQKEKQEATSIRVDAGYAFSQFVWEVKYQDQDHMKIAFYSMLDGTFIDEYTIPREARP